MELAAAVGRDDRWVTCLFDRIVCGVDGSPSSRIAVAQARRVATPGAIVDLVSIVERSPDGWPRHAPDEERQYYEAQLALEAARERAAPSRSQLLFGAPGTVLVDAAARRDASLLVVGDPPGGRLGRTVLGGVGTYLLEAAPCSLLIARDGDGQASFPRRIAVGHDGSAGATYAYAAADALAQRLDASLQILVARGGDPVREDGLPLREELESSPLSPVDALSDAATHLDLLVVGARGVRNLAPLGEVAERIAHLARCSVLVVREPADVGASSGDGDARGSRPRS